MASKEIFNKSRNEMEDIWDDTALIRMYEESIRVTVPVEQCGSTGWKTGDRCTAPFPDDELWYKATIRRIEGNQAFVIYEGYEDDGEVLVSLEDLAVYAEYEDEESNTENDDALVQAPAQLNVNSIGAAALIDTFRSNPSNFLPPFAPPPPAIFENLGQPDQVEALSSMLMSWYMSGYHTGCYVTMQQMRQDNGNNN